MPANVAVVLACSLWMIGIVAHRPLGHWRTTARTTEFWWAFAGFASGGLGTLASFSLVDVSPDEVTLFRILPIGVASGLLIVSALRRVPIVPFAALPLAIFFGFLFTHGFAGTAIAMAALSLLVYLPFFVAPREGYDLDALAAGMLSATGAVVASLLVAVILTPSQMLGPCRFDKCSLWGESLGAVGTGNALGMFLAGAGAISLFSVRSFLGFASITVGSFLLVDLTSSRSALVSWSVAVGVALAFLLSRHFVSRVFVALASLGVAIAAFVMPFLGWRGDAFTGRGSLWTLAQELIGTHPLFGLGSSYWVGSGGDDSIVRNYSTHNIATEILVSAGYVGLLLLVLSMLLAVVFARSTEGSRYAIGVVGVSIALSITEVTSLPGRVYLVPIFFAFALIVSQAASPARREDKLLEAAFLEVIDHAASGTRGGRPALRE